jgi:hypothetical protein
MFEISIFCVIVLAIGYWTALWWMGRHDDVLHGDFVETEPGSEAVPAISPVPTSAPRIDRRDSLQSLLKAIKRDLKDAAQI